MPYLTIVQAAEATGKSEKTIRRLTSKPESKQYITRDGDSPNAPVQIDSSYLASVYPMTIKKEAPGQVDTIPGQDIDIPRHDVQTPQQSDTEKDFIAFLKEELKKRDEELAARQQRIEDLTDKLTSIKLLTEGKPLEERKKAWWRW